MTKKAAVQTKKKVSSVKSDQTPKNTRSLKALLKRKPKTAKPQLKRLSSSYRLFRDSLSLLVQHWRLFGGIVLVNGILVLTLVGGLGGGLDVKTVRNDVGEALGQFGSSVTLYGLLIGAASTTTSEQGGAYYTVVLIVISLAVIWVLRQILAGEKVGVRDGFYKGMYPLVPFVLVLLVVGLQLLPLLVAGFLYSAVYAGGIAVHTWEIALWAVPILLLSLWSIRMVSGSIFALYIVTLPDMRPLSAIRSARKLVRYYRWAIIRKIMFLAFAYLILGALLTIPLIMLVPGIVVWVFVLLSMVAFILAHAYFYHLYRELL